MAFDLKEINFRTVADPKGFIEECDDVYARRGLSFCLPS